MSDSPRTDERNSDPWETAEAIVDRVDPPTFPDREFDVTEHGAAGDGETDCTAAFADAVAACTAAGGGRVHVPAGEYRTGPIHLDDGVELHLAEGATLAFRTDPDAYLPVVKTRWEGTELYNYSPMIYTRDATDVAVTGAGTVDGRASDEAWWPWCGLEKYGAGEEWGNQGRDVRALEGMATSGVPVDERVFGAGHYLRPNLVQFYECANVLVEGVSLARSPMWLCHPVRCENVTVRDVTVDTRGPNNDGCNPESCTDVLIEDCYFDAGDDCVAIKSGREADGRRVDVPCENVVVRGCEFRNLYGAVTVGSEMSGGVRNVFVEDCTGGARSLSYGVYIKTNAARGGFLEGLHVRGLHLSALSGEVLRCNFHRGVGTDGEFTPRVADVTLTDVVVEDAGGLFALRGFEHSRIGPVAVRDSRFPDVDAMGTVEDADVAVTDVTVNGERCDSLADVAAAAGE
ncbi:MAG: glycoside hydrolase family 28 protein [Halobacteriaceae archaeon]